MNRYVTYALAALLVAQPMMAQALEMPATTPANKAAQPAKAEQPKKKKKAAAVLPQGSQTGAGSAHVAGTQAAVASSFDAETVEATLLIGGVIAVTAVGAFGGGKKKHSTPTDCHCGGGGTGTTGT